MRVIAQAFLNNEALSANVTLQDVLYVPDLKYNLLSVKQITAKGGQVSFGEKGGFIRMGSLTIPFRKYGGSYLIDLRSHDGPGGTHEQAMAFVTNAAQRWHDRIGHSGANVLTLLGERDVGVPPGLKLEDKCDVCEVSKHVHFSFPRLQGPRSTRPFEFIHTDVAGPLEYLSLGGARYLVNVIDDLTSWTFALPMQERSETFTKLKKVLGEIKAITAGRRGERLRCDNVGSMTTTPSPHGAPSMVSSTSLAGPTAPSRMARPSDPGVPPSIRPVLFLNKLV